MNPQQMARIAPTAILLAYLVYSGYTLESSTPLAAERETEITRGLEVVMSEVAAAGEELVRLEGKLRDPFQIVVPPPPEPEPGEVAAAEALPDPLEPIVSALNLEATFVQGKDQIAIIDGKIYSKGQTLAIDQARAAGSKLVLLFVKPTGVILRGDGKDYALGYPERFSTPAPAPSSPAIDPAIDPGGQTELLRRLLSSPLGAMGKSLLGGIELPQDATRAPRPTRARTLGDPR